VGLGTLVRGLRWGWETELGIGVGGGAGRPDGTEG
jgi:hypothetical protein